MKQVYALIDKELLEKESIDLDDYIKFLNRSSIKIAQYRDKSSTLESVKRDIVKIKRDFKGLLIVDDYLKLLEYADGLHLGQEDLRAISNSKEIAIKIIRDNYPNKILGISTHNLEEILEANTLNLDYIGLGAYRDTYTKKDAYTKGSILLKIAKESKHKVALIGGVTIDDNFTKYHQINYKVIGSDLLKVYRDKIN